MNALRIAIMTVVTIGAITVILGGENNLAVGLSFAVVLTGIPSLVGVVVLQYLQRAAGTKVGMLLALIGLLPLLFVVIVTAGMGVKGGGSQYARDIMEAGILWSLAWIATTPMVRA